MAAEAWKAQFRRLVVEAEIRLVRVCETFYTWLPKLTSSMVAGDANTVREAIQLALDALGDENCSDLAFATSSMTAAKLLALRGDSINPALRLLRVNYDAERNAAIKLTKAESEAREAYAFVNKCRGHLGAVLLLMGHVSLPDVDDVINAEHLAAVADLRSAILAVQLSVELATAARKDVSGAS
uniref:Uncharacterized protein n=1 Tax=Oryza punctata TaxID=4537 RepID=A0A0E0JE97_ORYPU